MGASRCIFQLLLQLSFVTSSLAWAAPEESIDYAGIRAVQEAKTLIAQLDSCPVSGQSFPKLARSKTYDGAPFSSGEVSKYELKYGPLGVLVGFGFMRVEKPVLLEVSSRDEKGKLASQKVWHRVFSGVASTGDWYRYVFQAYDTMKAYSRPWDHAVTRSYLSQNEQKPLSEPYKREKWVDYDHANCKATFKQELANADKGGEFPLLPGASDALTALYEIRTLDYSNKEKRRLLVHTSGKNWWLEITPLGVEAVKVNAGEYTADKLSIKSYLGQELQQKGSLVIWIANEHPNRPMVKVEGEVTFGKVALELHSFTPGG